MMIVPTISLTRLRPKLVAQWGVFAVPLLLLIAPALHYSLDTPIGLFERSPHLANKYNSASDFLSYLRTTLLEPSWRFRPFYYIWNGLVWKVFGDSAWLHHLIRWLICCGAVALFIAAFRRFQGMPHTANASTGGGFLWGIIPLALLAYLLLFFPNVPTVRIECVELYTVFFLGLCNWAAALMLAAERASPSHHALFCLGWLGLLFSKEVNVAPALWLLAFWWALAIANRRGRGPSTRKLLAGSSLTLTLCVAIYKVSQTLELATERGHYFAPSKPILDRFTENAANILQGLLQYETSVFITAAFTFLLMALIVLVVAKVARREFNGELAFVFLLLGEFISMFLVLSIQYDMTLRYWSILVPCLATLLAFAAKFLLQAAMRHRTLANCTALALAAFIALFTAANYYNFLHQVIIQHSARNLDDLVISEIAQLINSGKYVQTNPYSQHYEEIWRLGWDHVWKEHWPKHPYDEGRVHQVPPKDPTQPYYLVDILDMGGQPALAGGAHASLVGRTDYGILRQAARVAGLLQGGAPQASVDWGMFPLGEYRWAIYALPESPPSGMH